MCQLLSDSSGVHAPADSALLSQLRGQLLWLEPAKFRPAAFGATIDLKRATKNLTPCTTSLFLLHLLVVLPFEQTHTQITKLRHPGHVLCKMFARVEYGRPDNPMNGRTTHEQPVQPTCPSVCLPAVDFAPCSINKTFRCSKTLWPSG